MKSRSVFLGLLAGAMILLASLAHSVAGWQGLRVQLARSGVGPDLMSGLFIGWQFGGAMMVAMGIIVIATFLRGRRGEQPWLLPVRVIGLMYVLFGVAAIVATGGELFFLAVFVLPGVLLLAAAADR